MRPGSLSPPAERTAVERNPSQTRSRTMAFIKTIFTSLLLSLVLAGSALAGARININSADVETIDPILFIAGPTHAGAALKSDLEGKRLSLTVNTRCQHN